MKSKMRKKLIAFMLCMVLVICNSVSILADAPAAATTTTEKQVKETGTAKSETTSEENKSSDENSADNDKETSKQSADSKKEESDGEKAPETKTTEKKKETTVATTETKEDDSTETTTKAKEETTEAAEKGGKDETTETKDDSDKKDKTTETSEETDKDKTTEAKKEAAPTELTYDDENVKVTVSAVAEGAIPADATLKVVPILKDDTETKDQYTEVEQKIQEKAAETETEIKGFLAYDITFVDKDGNEIEPNSEVKVSMEYKEAALPAEITAEDAKTSEVSVMHLEEDDAGNVSKVVDMGEAGKVDTLETTDAKQVEKVEVKTESFSVFTITWSYDNGRYDEFTIGVNYGYFDENNKWIEWRQDELNNVAQLPNIKLEEHDRSNPLDLSQYQIEIDGYSYLETRVDNEKNGNEVKSLFVSQEDYNYGLISGTYYYVNYIDINNASHEQWLSSSIMGEQEGNVYFIYEKTGLEIEDNIIDNGTLNAVFKGLSEDDLEGVTYVWSRSDEEDGAYTDVEKINYQGGASNLSEDGSALYPSYDEGARKWYKVKAVFPDGSEVVSEPFQVPYFDELQNGSFETPQVEGTSSNKQYTNDQYKNAGGVWQSTGVHTDGRAIEIVHEGRSGGDTAYNWYNDSYDPNDNWENAAPDGSQFAELNAQAAGALYQDVLTMEKTTLYSWLQHRARGDSTDSWSEYDTMYLVIMPTKEAINEDDQYDLTTQNGLQSYLWSKCGVNINKEYTGVGDSIPYNENGILVVRVTSDDQNWHEVGDIIYEPTASVTRFFFVAGDTDSGNNTVGNFLDDVHFTQELPPVADDEFTLELKKNFAGLDDTSLQEIQGKIEFTISAKDGDRDLTETEIKELFGIDSTTIQREDLSPQPDGSLLLRLMNRKILNGKSYEVTITESNAELEDYELSSQFQVSIAKGDSEPTEGEPVEGTAATFTLSGKDTVSVTFTNTYESNKSKDISFTKKWDDANNQFGTRPESLEVTLKPTITVRNNQDKLETIELTGDQIGVTPLTKTIKDESWNTTWTDVPVYYTYQGAKVKIDYTVVEGEIHSDYVYEATSDEALAVPEGGMDSVEADTFNASSIKKATSSSGQSSRAMMAKASAKTLNAETNNVSEELGEPAHRKYIEYDASSGEYTLNLNVTGAKGEASGVDVLFVIDTSGSMGTGWGNQYYNLLPKVKELLNGTYSYGTYSEGGIIDQIFENPDNVNSVAYVSFSDKSGTRTSEWFDKNNKNGLKDSIRSLRATGGTNWTYAMQRATSALAQRANSGNEKVVIFLSDGDPTYTINSWGREEGYGSATEYRYYTDAIKVVEDSASLQNADIFSVYLTSGTRDGMEIFANGTGASLVNGSDDLSGALEDILKIIIPTYKNVVISDTLSDYVDFVGDETVVTRRAANGNETTLSTNDYTVERNGKTITVKLLNGDELDDGATYTVSFKVKPNETANQEYAEKGYGSTTGQAGTGPTSEGQPGFYSNTSASVSYTVNDKDGSAEYLKPVVQVTTHNLTFTKEWNHPADVTEPTQDVNLYVTYTDGTSGNITLKATEGWTKVLENVPITKKIATVTETPVIEDYEPSYQISSDGTSATIINNYAKLTTTNIHVKKEWVGGEEESIQVALYCSVNDGAAELKDTKTLNAANGWSDGWTGLTAREYVDEKWQSYTYAVREVKTPAGYSSSIDYDIQGDTTNVTITNTYDSNCADENYYMVNVLQTEKLNVSKIWVDDGNAANLRPENLPITVSDGTGGSYNVTLSDANSWNETLTVLKKKGVVYSATEPSVSYYNSSKNSNGTNISFTNTLQSTSITVKKEWNDGNTNDRPDGIQFELQYKGESDTEWKKYGTYSLLEEDVIYDENGEIKGNWQKTITGLPAQYEYRVKEVNVPGQYHSEVTPEKGGKDTTFTITNTLNWSLKKTNSPEGDETAVALQGATFELKKGDTLIATGISGQDGVVDWNEEMNSTTDKPYDLQNLNGDYVLTETKAPVGYQGLTTITWKLHFDDDGVLTSAASYKGNDPLVDGSNENAKDPYITLTSSSETGVVITVQNDLLYELPETGGSGTYWYTFSGVLLMMGAALIVYRQKRKREVLLRK